LTLGSRIKQARKAIDMTGAKLAELCEVTPQSVSGWERDLYLPSPPILIRISLSTNCDLQWLITGKSITSQVGHSEIAAGGRSLPSVDWGQIQLFREGLYKPMRTVRSHFDAGPDAFHTVVIDRSNEPQLSPGDGVVIDPSITPEPGDIVMVMHDGNVLLRRFRPRADGVELAPCNSDWPTISIQKLSPENFVGVVSETSKPRRR
jgi:transcriptional regulator with XRE-family HTH domain